MAHRIPLLIATATLALAGASAGVRADERADRAERSLPVGTVLEASIETTTDAVIFPGAPNGRLQVRGCDGCTISTVQADANTRYILGGDQVSLRDMAQFALRTPGRPLTIHYRLKDMVASRVTVLER